MMRRALFTTMMVCIVFASAEKSEVDGLNDERLVLPGLASDINPETSTQNFIASEEAQGFKPGSRDKILESIVNLRAYCLLAYDKAKDFAFLHPNSNSGIMSFVIAFGKKDTKKDKMANIVTGFATAIGESKGQFEQGISHYLLMHLGKAVFEGKRVVVKDGKSSIFQSKILGLKSTPQYFDKLAVSYVKHLGEASKVRSANKNADAQAAAQWLASGSKAKYKSFEDKQKAGVVNKVKAYKEDVYMNSLKAIKTSWEKNHSLSPMPVAGSVAGASVPAVTVPDKESVEKEAKLAAEKWIKNNSVGAVNSATKTAETTSEDKSKKEQTKKIRREPMNVIIKTMK